MKIAREKNDIKCCQKLVAEVRIHSDQLQQLIKDDNADNRDILDASNEQKWHFVNIGWNDNETITVNV